MKRECANCVFWQSIEDYDDGFCRRFPPQFSYTEHSEVLDYDTTPEFQSSAWSFPITDSSSYCGEHKIKPKGNNQ